MSKILKSRRPGAARHFCTAAMTVVLAAGSNAHAQPAEFYRSSVREAKGLRGKPLVVECEEIERMGDKAVVRERIESGAAMHSSLFFAQCIYDMAIQRGARYALVLSQKGGTSVIGFTNDASTEDLQRRFGAQAKPEHLLDTKGAASRLFR